MKRATFSLHQYEEEDQMFQLLTFLLWAVRTVKGRIQVRRTEDAGNQ